MFQIACSFRYSAELSLCFRRETQGEGRLARSNKRWRKLQSAVNKNDNPVSYRVEALSLSSTTTNSQMKTQVSEQVSATQMRRATVPSLQLRNLETQNCGLLIAVKDQESKQEASSS
jgi:hypothetical protein